MNQMEKEAWSSCKDVIHKSFGNIKDRNYKHIVDRVLKAFKVQGCKMNQKLHFRHSDLDYFLENEGAFSEELGERFSHVIRNMEQIYQGNWNADMLCDYWWILLRETPETTHKPKRTRSFQDTKR